MSTEPPASQDPKRLLTFMVLALVLVTGTNYLLDRLGLLPEPAPKPVPVAEAVKQEAQDDRDETSEVVADSDDPVDSDAEEPSAKVQREAESMAAAINPGALALGSSADDAYHLRVELSQLGAGVRLISSNKHRAEYLDGQPRDRPLDLLQRTNSDHPPLGLEILVEDDDGTRHPAWNVDQRPWTVLIDGKPLDDLEPDARASANPVKAITDQGRKGQEIAFRTSVPGSGGEPPLTITKVYRLWEGRDAVNLSLRFELPQGASGGREVVYRLNGPSGVPIEGEWYTYTFRNAFFGKGTEDSIAVETHSSTEIANDPDEYLNTEYPTAFAGVENQYFTLFLKPKSPASEVAIAAMTAVDTPKDKKKADLAVDLVSKPFELESGAPVTQEYALYAGPKTDEALLPYGAGELAIYRQVGRVPIIGFLLDFIWAIVNPIVALLSVWVIGPLLAGIYSMTATVASWFGGTRGSYGVAIILLTFAVRSALFPLSRKQAASAKRMQELQPQMTALREKHKDDKERIAQETFALYRKHGINPVGGCLPVLIQIPIFMTLWRTLNVSVALRQAEFLWIDNLAAPDMLAKLPFTLPLLGPYFNLLPLAVIGLMLLQMKLFTPPASSPEQETQQRVMKFMMVFMMLMFYRVPAGLALYFITSSIWSVSERLLLPKVTAKVGTDEDRGKDSGGPNGDKGGPGPASPGNGGGGWLSRKIEALMNEAAKETTIRRDELERGRRDRDLVAPTETKAGQGRTNPRKKRPGKNR